MGRGLSDSGYNLSNSHLIIVTNFHLATKYTILLFLLLIKNILYKQKAQVNVPEPCLFALSWIPIQN